MDAPAYPELLPVSVKMTHRYTKVSSRTTPCFIILKLLEIQAKINTALPTCSHNHAMFFRKLTNVFVVEVSLPRTIFPQTSCPYHGSLT